MKTQKLIVIAAIVCLLVGASSAAMAVDCAGGVIQGTEKEPLEVDEIVIDGQSCFVNNVIVTGDVTVVDSEDFTMIDCNVHGNAKITQGREVIIFGTTFGVVEGNLATNSNLLIRNNSRVYALINIVTGSMFVHSNRKADVKKNAVVGNLWCRDNQRLDSFENEVGLESQCRRSIDIFDGFSGFGAVEGDQTND
jgi:hypothetical protein